ncbi:MAG TPA: peptidoglycan DD-metalloendopeptidase family protein [Polyangia bacterium]|nr:peptidoglycan DD-metalloendopeptidase family protein [Polyangia bacterium]
MARSNLPRKRKRRSAQFRNSVRVGVVLTALTGINVYVFFFRDDTAVRKVLQPSSTSQTVAEEKAAAVNDSIPPSLGGPNLKTKGADKRAGGSPEAAAVDPDGRVVEGTIGPKDTLGTVLAREGFGASAGNVIKALSRIFDAKAIRPGDGYLVGFDAEGNPELFEYLPSPVQRYIVTPRLDGDGLWQARKEEKTLETRTAEAAGVIESSLYESVHKAGESSALVSLLVDLFAWDINFYIDTHPGDHWKVVVEKQYLGGQFYKYGNLLAAEYGGRVGTYRAFYWNAGQGGRYYDDKGQAIAKTMLKCPLRFVRVSSKFDRNRFHPILHTVKAHLGVDYAAPVGTPVWASAGGKVAEVGMRSGSGNTVVIAHSNGISTRYYHLSRFAKGLAAGKHVNQKEVIGYVGTTGLSTGPHLHFSVTRNGAFVDPGKIQVAREAPVANRGAFLEGIKPRIAALKALAPVVAHN